MRSFSASVLDGLGVESLGGIIYEPLGDMVLVFTCGDEVLSPSNYRLYRLDIWDENLANAVCSRHDHGCYVHVLYVKGVHGTL